MLGYAESEYVGHHIAEFHVEKLAAGEFLRRLTAGQPVLEYEARLRCRDGSIRHMLVSCNALWENGTFVHARCFSRDLTDRKRAEQRLGSMLRLSERLNATLEIDALLEILVREALLLVGADAGFAGVRTERGLQARRYLRSGAAEVFEEEFPPGHGLPGWVLEQRQPYLTNEAWQDEVIHPLERARFNVRSAVAVPILDGDGSVLGFFELHNKAGGFDAQDREVLIAVSRAAAVAMANALTHRAVLDAEDALREADRRKDEFLATLAHELRNPLAPIRNAVALFRTKRGLDAEVQWGHEVIQRQVELLVRLVDDLLDMSRVSRGLVELKRVPVSLSDVISAALETSRPLVEARGHTLEVALQSDSLGVHGDPTRLAQVLANLLNNAAKFTPPGGRIRLEARRDGRALMLRVVDNGIGIPREMLTRIFDLFAQVDRSLERTTGGLGIGLSLVRRLVELHGGKVEARSAGPGQGSEFIVTLPRALDVDVTTPVAPPMLAARGGAARRVLVVDDNRDSADSLAMLLRVLGHEVEVAHDGVEALRLAARVQPDVVLLDIGLPRINGYDVARQLRQMPWARSILLIAVTGWGQDEDRRRSRESGFDRHLVKPVDLAALQNLLASDDPPTVRVTH
jgi:signal transduction histidine kinase/ActR/RegA family two-component response regulator